MAASWSSVSRNELTDPPALQLDRRCSWRVSPKRALRSSKPDSRIETYLLHIRVRACAAFGDETVDPRRDNGQRDRAELEHGIVERAEPRSSNARSRAAFKTTAVANDVS